LKKRRKPPTKNRRKNRLKYLKRLKRIRALRKKKEKYPARSLFNTIIELTKRLKQIYPNNDITFYIQRVRPLHLNTQLIQQ
jgi:hypothetical protein